VTTTPISDLGLLSDCQSAALAARDGTIVWWPSPRFDSPSAFSSLLDADAGHWTIRPRGRAQASRRYRDATLVLETTFRAAGGVVRLTDALTFSPGARGHAIGREAPHALVRVVEVLEGEAEVEMELVPRLEYGLAVPHVVRERGGLATLGGPERLFLHGDRPVEPDGSSARATFSMSAGESAGWVLRRVPGAYAECPEPLDPLEALADTTAAWRSWSEQHTGYHGEYAEQVRLAALVVQGLTYAPSGAVVAAPTTSLPEIPGGEANWDYRFGWLRDAAMIAHALSVASCSDEACRYFDWIVRAGVTCVHAEQLQIMFGVDGERDLTEHALEHLDGYDGARPVRVGNAAWSQKQLDVLGHVLDAAWVMRDELGTPDAFTGAFLCQLADRAARQWREKDASIWEGRDGERHYTVSKLGCWIALDRAIRLGDRLGDDADLELWARERDAVRDTILREAWCREREVFAGALGSDHLDAGVLMMPLVDFIAADDPRMTSTIEAIEDELTDDGLVRRWTGARDGAFLLASFWLAECHARAGRLERARAVFERAAAAGNDLGLLAEEVDVLSGEPLGNMPQAIAHIGLVHAAVAITDARERQAVQA
jgi:GH15 family glucan-1,4-alpha-glucosidase